MSDQNHDTNKDTDLLGVLIRQAGEREPVPELVERRVRANVEQAWRDSARRQQRRPYLWAAAAVLSVAAIGILLVRGVQLETGATADFGRVALAEGEPLIDGESLRSSASAIAIGARIYTRDGDRLNIAVGSAASLRVAGNTAIRVNGPREITLLRGSVYFDSHDLQTVGQPFTVETPLGRLTDIGTQFLVSVDNEIVALHVRDGQVDFTGDRASANVNAGQGVMVAADGALARVDIDAGDPIWDWAEALAAPFTIDGASLLEFLQWAARETGRELRVASAQTRERIAQIRLSGDMNGWTPDEAILPVISTAGLSGSITVTDTLIVVR